MNSRTNPETPEISETGTGVDDEREFDRLAGILADGVVGAAGGLVGTAMLTVVLAIAESLGAFDRAAFGGLTRLVGLDPFVPAVPVGYLLFVAGGMVPWPLLFASLKEYLPGRTDPVKGVFFGGAVWTGFVLAFYTGQSGLVLALYVVLTFLAHVAYGVGLGLVFRYLTTRPSSLV